ncbi:hypothetical protein LINGRAHAP2_LOCUS18182 [Linum grandiflorum]
MFQLEKSAAEQSEMIKKLIKETGQMALYRSTTLPARSLAGSSSTAACTHRPLPRPTKSENGTKSCKLPKHQGVDGFDVLEGNTHDLREDNGGDA